LARGGAVDERRVGNNEVFRARGGRGLGRHVFAPCRELRRYDELITFGLGAARATNLSFAIPGDGRGGGGRCFFAALTFRPA